MKYLVYAALVFVSMLIFLPKDGTLRPDNLPLLLFLISCFALYQLFRLTKRIILLNKMRKLLLEKGAVIHRFSPLGIMGGCHLSAEKNGKTMHIVLLMHKHTRTHYHFESTGRVEYYKSNRLVYRAGGASGATISREVETKRIGSRTFTWQNLSNPAYLPVIVIDRQPSMVTDSVSNQPLAIGDAICKKVYWYNYASLAVNLDTLLAPIPISSTSP